MFRRKTLQGSIKFIPKNTVLVKLNFPGYFMQMIAEFMFQSPL